jgi:hypothetical protein
MSTGSARGRGGKFSKPKRGGGKHFSRDLQPLNADGEQEGMWGVRSLSRPRPLNSTNTLQDVKATTLDEEDEEESSEEESSEDDGQPKVEMTREERRAQAKARKAAAIAKQNQKVPEAGDLPSSEEEEEEEDEDADMPANPNHTAKARKQADAPAPTAATAETAKGKAKAKDPSQLSRREREALQAQQAKERYEKMHAEGKTEQAKTDLERLALVRERRDAEAARKKAEAEERAEAEKAKVEQVERESKRREAALGKKSVKGGKKKA